MNGKQVHKYQMNEWKTKWKSSVNPNRILLKSHKKFNTELISLINKDNLSPHQCGLMMQVKTQHIELSEYSDENQM